MQLALASVCFFPATLIELDVGSTYSRISRYAQHLRSMLPSLDPGITELTARAVGKLALVSGTYTAEYVEHEVKRCFEWLNSERNESRRYAAVCLLKELGSNCQTFFFQHVQQFFDSIFIAAYDIKPYIRERAAEAVRSAILVTAQRETREFHKPSWYAGCYAQITMELRSKPTGKEERIHGSLLVLCELLRCSNVDAERTRMGMEEAIKQQSDVDLTSGSVSMRFFMLSGRACALPK